MTLTTSFAGLHARLSYADLGPNAIRAAKERCIDYLGALAGGINGSVVEPVRAATLQACALSGVNPSSLIAAVPMMLSLRPYPVAFTGTQHWR